VNLKSAIAEVNKRGALLVFPIKNRKDPLSLWHHFYPRSEMKWEWDDDGDHRVADLWHLREKLSSSGQVIYVKWFQNRATLISRELYPSLLKVVGAPLSREAEEMYDVLCDNSPLSTKQLKEMMDLKGPFFEKEYNQRTKELWKRLQIVGVGEVDDGAFPSLAIAAAKLYFEEEWLTSQKLTKDAALSHILRCLGEKNLFYRYALKIASN